MEVDLKLTTQRDLPLLLAWRQNPVIMRWFKDRNETWEQHLKWWESKPISRMILVSSLPGLYERPVGEVHAVDKGGGIAEVGLYIGDRKLWGQGLGVRVMSLFLHLLEGFGSFEMAIAHIHPKNVRSKKMFERAGFCYVMEDSMGYLSYVKESL